MIARLCHTVHLCFRPHFWVAYAVSLAGAIGLAVSSLDWRPDVAAAFYAGYFELYGSIVVAMGLAHVLTIDREEGAKEVLLTYGAAAGRLAFERVVAGFILSAGPLLLIAAALWGFTEYALPAGVARAMQFEALLADSAASWVYLAGITVLASTAVDNWLGGLFAGGLYWIIDGISNGLFTRDLFLFSRTFPSEAIAADLNQTLLYAGGLVLCGGALTLFGYNRKRW